MTSHVKKFLPLLAGMFLMALAAPSARADNDNDPIEPFNRAMFSFNRAADSYLIRPVALGYRYVTPQVVRTHLGNVSNNLFEPLNTINALLQGDVTQGVTSFWRFVINSTIGLAGINDVATEAGLERRTEDLGQTLAVWGVGSGPYIVLPILGPSNLRDTTGMVGEWFLDPVNYAIDDTWGIIALRSGQTIIRREQLIAPVDEIYESSLDPYVSFRTIYEQHRAAQIKNRYSDKDRKIPSLN